MDNVKNIRLLYPVIYCQKYFDVINYVTYCWMMCSFMWLSSLQFETKLQICIIMGINTYKIFISGGISSDLRSEITLKLNFRPYIRRYISPNENFEYSYPLIIHLSSRKKSFAGRMIKRSLLQIPPVSLCCVHKQDTLLSLLSTDSTYENGPT